MENRGFTTTMTADVNEQFVDPAEFLKQMTSRRKLQRCDDSGTTVRGLLDPETGRRILINEDRLMEAVARWSDGQGSTTA